MTIQSSGRHLRYVDSHHHQFRFTVRKVRITSCLIMIGLVTSACTNGFQDAKVNDAQIPTSEVPFVGVVGLPSQQLLTELPCP